MMKKLNLSAEEFQKNFQQMSSPMKRHLAKSLVYYHGTDAMMEKSSDPLFELDTEELQRFYSLNAFLYPKDVRARIKAAQRKEHLCRPLYLLGQELEPHIFEQVDLNKLRQEMAEEVVGQSKAKRALLDLVEHTNTSCRPFRVLLVGCPGSGKSLLSGIVSRHYANRRIDCGSFNTAAALAGTESSYSDSDYGLLVAAALDQAECLVLSGLDRMTASDHNGSPFPILTQLLREHKVHDLYLGVSVHINANVIAEVQDTRSLPADLLSAFDMVVALDTPTRRERVECGTVMFKKRAQGRMTLQHDVVPFLIDNYCPDDGMQLLHSVTERLVNAAFAQKKQPRCMTVKLANKLLGPANLDEFETNVLKFRRSEAQYPETMRKVGNELVRYVAANRDKKDTAACTACAKARERFSYIASIQQDERPFRFDRPGFDRRMQEIIGLEPVKEVLRARLAGMEASNAAVRPLLFVGPAGTGKTQLCRTLAKALDIPFEKQSCAGVSGNNIKGSSTVYDNSSAGLVATALKRAGTTRMLLLLDEVDKAQPDAQWALLDLLDSHRSFYEQHIACDIDVHQTVFVLTANDLNQLSPILRDRCDIIHMGGYTCEQKLDIARQSMLPSALHKYALADDTFPDALVEELVSKYCRAPGCRDLESCLDRLCEEMVLHAGDAPDPAGLLKKLFGAPVADLLDEYPQQVPEDTCGIVRILAVASSAAGGCYGVSGAVQVLQTPRPGIVITGHAEDGLKESVLTAVSAAEAAAGRALPEGSGLHIHFCGDSPKDGPSAGCAIALAVVSILLGIPVPRTTTMTGTIDLFGCCGRVGGIAEKCQAALDAGCKQIFIPSGSKEEVTDLLRQKAAAQGAEILPTSHFHEILEHCLHIQPTRADSLRSH